MNTTTSEYWELFTKKKHIYPNRVNNKPATTNNNTFAVVATNTITKPTFYRKKPWNSQQKPDV